MKKIEITISKNESEIYISNSEKLTIAIDTNNGTLKASDVFRLFDNGTDVLYECKTSKIEEESGLNLSKVDLMFNDCLELICSIIASVNQKIIDFNEDQNNNEVNNDCSIE